MELHEKNKIKLALSLENGKVSKRKQNFKMSMKWPVKVLILTFCFSTFFSIFSQLINSKVGIALSILIIFVFLAIGVVFDIIGVATTVCSRNVFFELAKKEDRAAKLACKFVSNSEKVSSFCCDIIGDICGVLSGSAGTSLLIKINMQMSGTLNLLLSTIISAIIASLTVFFKALGKTIAINKSHSIVYRTCKILALFHKRRKNGK